MKVPKPGERMRSHPLYRVKTKPPVVFDDQRPGWDSTSRDLDKYKLTDEQVDKIVKQVEFYFSDANLPTDAFLIKKVKADPTGFVPIGVVCSFNRMKTLLKKHPPIETVAAILREHSECLVVSDDGIRVRRTEPLPDIDHEDVQARTVVAGPQVGDEAF